MIPTQGRDSTIDPYYFSRQGFGTMSSDDLEQLKQDVATLQAVVNGSAYEDGLVQKVNSLQEAVDEIISTDTKVQVKTTEEWEAIGDTTSLLGVVYIYQDEVEGDIVQKMKVGDGTSKINELPFLADSSTLVTQVEKDNWNNKVSVSIQEDDENVIFSK